MVTFSSTQDLYACGYFQLNVPQAFPIHIFRTEFIIFSKTSSDFPIHSFRNDSLFKKELKIRGLVLDSLLKHGYLVNHPSLPCFTSNLSKLNCSSVLTELRLQSSLVWTFCFQFYLFQLMFNTLKCVSNYFTPN